ncbi:MAG: ACT domain-containing protein [Acidobacteria bacterium]|nr:ACT domain-containing protein [Acidobacteriota bacterium]
MAISLTLALQPDSLALCRLPPSTPIPDWVPASGFLSLTRTKDELSVVCLAAQVPAAVQQDSGWRAFKVEGPLDLAMTGVLTALSQPMVDAGISLFVISTFDTDYVLVRTQDIDRASKAWEQAGHRVNILLSPPKRKR